MHHRADDHARLVRAIAPRVVHTKHYGRVTRSKQGFVRVARRLAKRHGLQNPNDAHDWQMAEKARALYKKADAHGLAVLIFEAMLIGFAGSAIENKDDDPLTEAACLYNIDTKALRGAVVKAEKEKTRTKAVGTRAKVKPASKTKVARK